jgi:hypothetical protein
MMMWLARRMAFPLPTCSLEGLFALVAKQSAILDGIVCRLALIGAPAVPEPLLACHVEPPFEKIIGFVAGTMDTAIAKCFVSIEESAACLTACIKTSNDKIMNEVAAVIAPIRALVSALDARSVELSSRLDAMVVQVGFSARSEPPLTSSAVAPEPSTSPSSSSAAGAFSEPQYPFVGARVMLHSMQKLSLNGSLGMITKIDSLRAGVVLDGSELSLAIKYQNLHFVGSGPLPPAQS